MQENVVEDFDFYLKKAEVRAKPPKSKSTARIILLEKNNGHYQNRSHTAVHCNKNHLQVLILHTAQTLALLYCFSLLCTGQS